MDNYKKYLPSTKFIAIILIIIVFIAIFFTIKGVISLFKGNKPKNGEPIPMLVGNIAQKDSNGNGIADWEEYLWGLDPKKNGGPNKEFIDAKKKALTQSGEMVPLDDSKKITDNELLSQQFFATIVSLQQTGNLNEESMKTISEAVGQNIEATPIPDIYTQKMLTIKADGILANDTYKKALSKLITEYQDADIGSELTLIIQGLSNNDPQALYAATTVAESYQFFGKNMMKIPVPKSIANFQLSAANNYEKTGEVIKDLAQIISDPILGMRSIINYKKYSDALSSDLERISEFLQ